MAITPGSVSLPLAEKIKARIATSKAGVGSQTIDNSIDAYSLHSQQVDGLGRSYMDRLKLKQQDAVNQVTPEQRLLLDDETAGQRSLASQAPNNALIAFNAEQAKIDADSKKTPVYDWLIPKLDAVNKTFDKYLLYEGNSLKSTPGGNWGTGTYIGSTDEKLNTIRTSGTTPDPKKPDEVAAHQEYLANVQKEEQDFQQQVAAQQTQAQQSNVPDTTGMSLKDKLNVMRTANGQQVVDYPAGGSSTQTNQQQPVVQQIATAPVVQKEEPVLPAKYTPQGLAQQHNSLAVATDLRPSQKNYDDTVAFYQQQEVRADIQRKAEIDAELELQKSTVAATGQQYIMDEKLAKEKAAIDTRMKEREIADLERKTQAELDLADTEAKTSARSANLLASITGNKAFGTLLQGEGENKYKAKLLELQKEYISASGKLADEVRLIQNTLSSNISDLNKKKNADNLKALAEYKAAKARINSDYDKKTVEWGQKMLSAKDDLTKKMLETNKYAYEQQDKITDDAIKYMRDSKDKQTSLDMSAERLRLTQEAATAKSESVAAAQATRKSTLLGVSQGTVNFENLPMEYKAAGEQIWNEFSQNAKVTTVDSKGKSLEPDKATYTTKDSDGNTIVKSVTELNIPDSARDRIFKEQQTNLEVLNGKGGAPGTQQARRAIANLALLTKKWGPALANPVRRKALEQSGKKGEYDQAMTNLQLVLKDATYGLGALTGPDKEFLENAIGKGPEGFIMTVFSQDPAGYTNQTLNRLYNLFEQTDQKEDLVASTIKNRYKVQAYANGVREQFLDIGTQTNDLKDLKATIDAMKSSDTPGYVPGLTDLMSIAPTTYDGMKTFAKDFGPLIAAASGKGAVSVAMPQ